MNTVTITALGFVLQVLVVPLGAGVVVEFVNSDTTIHRIVFDAITPTTPFSDVDIVPNGGTLTLTFDARGTYTYHDLYDPRMTGMVTVY